MTITEAIEQAKKVKEQVRDGNYLTAWALTLPIQQYMIDTGMALGFRSENPSHVAELKAELEVAADACDKPPVSGTVEMKKIGDGEILKKLLTLLVTVLPLILKPGE